MTVEVGLICGAAGFVGAWVNFDVTYYYDFYYTCLQVLDP